MSKRIDVGKLQDLDRKSRPDRCGSVIPIDQLMYEIQCGINLKLIKAADAHASSAFVKWKFFVSFLLLSLSLSLVLVLSVSHGHQTWHLIENITSSTGLWKHITSKAHFPQLSDYILS